MTNQSTSVSGGSIEARGGAGESPYERVLAAARSLSASQSELDELANMVQFRIEFSGRNHQKRMASDMAVIREDLAGIAAGMDALGMFPETGLLVVVPSTEHQQGVTLDRYGELLSVDPITTRRTGAPVRSMTDRELQAFYPSVIEELHSQMDNRLHK